MSQTITAQHTLTMLVLGVDGILRSVTKTSDRPDDLAMVRSALGPHVSSAKRCTDAPFDLEAWVDEDGWCRADAEQNINHIASSILSLWSGRRQRLVGPVVYLATDDNGTMISPDADQAQLLAQAVDGIALRLLLAGR